MNVLVIHIDVSGTWTSEGTHSAVVLFYNVITSVPAFSSNLLYTVLYSRYYLCQYIRIFQNNFGLAKEVVKDIDRLMRASVMWSIICARLLCPLHDLSFSSFLYCHSGTLVFNLVLSAVLSSVYSNNVLSCPLGVGLSRLLIPCINNRPLLRDKIT